jgi:hypothetical protein
MWLYQPDQFGMYVKLVVVDDNLEVASIYVVQTKP